MLLLVPRLTGSDPVVAYGVFGAGVWVLSFALAFFDVSARYPRGQRSGWLLVLLGLNILGVAIYWVGQRVRAYKAAGAPTSGLPR